MFGILFVVLAFLSMILGNFLDHERAIRLYLCQIMIFVSIGVAHMVIFHNEYAKNSKIQNDAIAALLEQAMITPVETSEE